MILQKYDSYKDSGVEWLGEIPDGWEVKRVKDVSGIYNGSTPKSDILSYWDGDIVWITPKDISKNDFIFDSERKITKEGYLSCGTFLTNPNSIIMTTRAPIGNISISKVMTCTNQGCKTLVPKSINYKFLFYMLYSQKLKLQCLGSGTTFFELSTSELKAMLFQSPNFQEQTQIANFLDKKTSQIDSKISLLQEKITSYEDLKKSLINETVCRGLNKDIELKDSEIEWIGDIPKHWNIERLKNIFNERAEKNKKLDGEPITDNILSVMKDIGVINHRDKGNVGNKMSEDISGYKIVHPKDIVVNKMNVIIGSVGISKEYGALSVVYIILKTKPESHPEFYDYVFRSKYFQKYLRTIATGILEIREAVNSTLFKHQGLPNPPKEEQIAIANYLDEKTTKINNIISKIKDQVNTLKEFRKTLINDVVTGKVRALE